MTAMTSLSPEERKRYAHHLNLESIGEKGQLRLKKSSVVVVGAGGLGSPALSYLAAAGVGKLGVVDFDLVERSNLQRQILHGESWIGKAKVKSAAARIAAINPLVEVLTHPDKLDSSNALQVLNDYDIIIDGSDNFPTRYLLNDAAILLGKPLIYGAIHKFEGQVSVFNHRGGWRRPKNWNSLSGTEKTKATALGQHWVYEPNLPGPSYRDLYPEPPPLELAPNCGDAGVLGALPGIIGTLQATEAIKIALGIGTTLSGRVLCYDALAMTFREFKLDRDPNAPPIDKLVDYDLFCQSDLPFEQLDVQQIATMRQEGWQPFVLDVRSAEEAAVIELSFSDWRQSIDELKTSVSKLPTDKDILCHCQKGMRSAKVLSMLAQMGFGRLYNMKGGLSRWVEVIETDVYSPRSP